MIQPNDNLEAMSSMETGEGRIIEDQPFHLLVVGDWSGAAEKKELSTRRPVEIDRDNFDDVMARICPVLDLDINGEKLPLKFSSIEDFHPDRIFEQVPLFSDLRDLRRRLNSDESFNAAAREVRSLFDAAITPEPDRSPAEDAPVEASEDLLSRILSQPSGSGATRAKKTSSGPLDNLIGELMRPHLVTVDQNEQKQMLDAVDDATGALMRKILHDHRFQALEAAWRGLFLIVRRADTDTDLKLFILDLTKDELAENLKNSSDLTDSFFYKTLVTDAVETPGARSWAAVIGNYGFLPVVDDVAALVRISKVCAAADAPFISHMRPEVLGIHSFDGKTDPRSWNVSPQTEAGKLWATLRSIPESGYLGMTIPRFLGRLPYGAETDPVESFSFEEFDRIPEHDKYLWINSCFACGLLLCQSFSASGREMGRSFIQDIEGLPLHTFEAGSETVYTPCAEVQLTHEASDRLLEHGLMPLVSYKNTDHVKLARFQSIAHPVTGLQGKWKRAS